MGDLLDNKMEMLDRTIHSTCQIAKSGLTTGWSKTEKGKEKNIKISLIEGQWTTSIDTDREDGQRDYSLNNGNKGEKGEKKP